MNEPQTTPRHALLRSDAIFVVAACIGGAVLLIAVGAFVRLVTGVSLLP